MSQTIYYAILFIIILEFIWDRFLLYLNTTRWTDEVPEELNGIYKKEEYVKQQAYSKVNYKFGWLSGAFSLLLIVLMITLNGFALVDHWASQISSNMIIRALVFFGIIGFASTILNLPFSIYSTFVIEEKFGFNKTKAKVFVLDAIKSLFIGAILGGGVLALVICFYDLTGSYFWFYAWMLISVFMLFITMFYTSLLLPMFNKQTILEDGELKTAIQNFSDKVGFKLDNIFIMDGSKRSTKANAFFSGLGAKKRIVLYDTLVDDLSVSEVVAVLAHEIGHYKKKHTFWAIITGIIQMGVMLFLFSLFVGSQDLSAALGVQQPMFHIALIAFGILYSPISEITGLLSSVFSRKNEYEADAFAAKYYNAEHLITALKVISTKALSNLTPHPWYVFFHYSHPPLLQRINALRKRM